MKKLLKFLVIAFPALALVVCIGLIAVMGANNISFRQIIKNFRNPEGLRSSFVGTTFVVTLAPMGGGSTERVDCQHINCPTKELGEITRSYFGSSLPTEVTEDANGQQTDAYIDRVVSWKKEMNRAVLHYLPAKYMGYVPVDVSLDTRGQIALRILIWLTILGVIGSVIVVPVGLVMQSRSNRSGDTSEDDGRDSGKVASLGSYLK